MYYWKPHIPRPLEITETTDLSRIDADKIVPPIPKSIGHRRYKPVPRHAVDRVQAISNIIDEYVPAPDLERINELLKPVAKPYKQSLWISESEIPPLCPCCSPINQANIFQRSRHPGPASIGQTHVSKTVPEPKYNSVSLAPPTHISDSREIRPGIIVTERSMTNPHGMKHYSQHDTHDHYYHGGPSARLQNMEIFDAEERFHAAEARLNSFARSTDSPELPRKVQFPGGKLSVRFATLPMRYVYTPPYYH